MDDEHRPYTIERALDDLRYAVDLLLGEFSPSALARMRLVRRVTRENVLVWLAPIEALVRRILLFVALQTPLPNFTPHCSRDLRLRSAMRDAPFQELSENSADWRVLFRVWPGASPPRAAKRVDAWAGQHGCRASDYNAYPLARRIEALVRVAQDPARAVARLARKIVQFRTELWEVFAPYRHRGGPVQTILNEAQAAVDATLADTS